MKDFIGTAILCLMVIFAAVCLSVTIIKNKNIKQTDNPILIYNAESRCWIVENKTNGETSVYIVE